MIQFLDRKFIEAKTGFNRFVTSLREEERGVSSFVATIMLILIAVLIAGVFWKYIKQWIDTMWEDITSKSGSSNFKTN